VRAPLLAAILGTALAACGGSKPGEGVPDAGYNCAEDTRGETFTAGMSKVGTQGLLTFKLMSSTPAPPSRGDNTWELDIVDQGGAPVAGATVTVVPFMPDHNHGTSIKAVVTEKSPGHYEATPINLWMVGFWQITITARPAAGGAPDAVPFNFCIPG
jgi:hypothetical protein